MENKLQQNLQQGKPLMWSERVGNELYVYRNGELVYKRWYKRNSNEKSQPSLIFNNNGWPNVWIT